jgi:raffinose/stachyose/melibiose transport system substrate-binding protein
MKRNSLKRVAALGLCSAMVLGMAACGNKGSQNETKSASNGKVTLNVWHQWSNDTNELKAKYDEAVAAYMKKNPNVEIKTQTLDTEAYKTKISAEFAGDAKGIDVFYYWGAGAAKKLVKANKLLPIDKYVTDDVKSKLADGSTAAFTYDDKLYSVPSFSWYMTLYCNKALFDQAGATIPTTYDEMVDSVKKLEKLDGVTPFASGAKDGWNAAFIYQALALREVGAADVNKMLSGKEKFGADGYKDAANKVVDLYKMGAFGKNPLEQSNDDANAAFGTGKAAMRLMGSWFANGLYTDGNTTINPDDVVAVKIPMITGKGNPTDYCGGFVESFWVNKNTKYADEAAKFAVYINEAMGNAAYETGSGFTAWKDDVDTSKLNPLFLQIKSLLDEGQTGVLAWDTSLEAEPATVHNEQVQTLFSPDANVDSFIEEHKAAINE